jgi:crotonobetainyl-CoA:carnitine CoA-transferase CaiB-like acyl-CoA transferase
MLTRQSVACVEVYPRDFSDFANTSTAMRQHGLMLEVEHPSVGEYLRYGPLIDFSDSPSPCLGPVTCVGEHAESVLRELGYSSGQVRDLEKAKVVVCDGAV